MVKHRDVIAVMVLLTAIFALLGSCSSGGSGGGGMPTPVAERFPIDGVVDLAAVGTVHQQVVSMTTFTGVSAGTTTLRWAAANDDRNLYLALEWDDATQSIMDPVSMATSTFDGVVVLFTNATGTALEDKADVRYLIMTKYGSFFRDRHVVSGVGDAEDVVGDGQGKMTWSPDGKYHAEFLIPLTPDAAGEDGVLNSSTRFNVVLYNDVIAGSPLYGSVGALSGSTGMAAGTDTSAWPALPYTTPGKYDEPNIPSNLTGLIVFISDHENPLGELYTFDPSISTNPNRIVTRVTNSTGLYMDCASLSHDKAKIAVHAGASATDFANFEIYTVPVSSGTPTRLTFNTVLDGHPAWSPHDDMIVYASFYAGSKAQLIVSTPTGSVLYSALTPSGANDNDPDWTPDGRIVFKTDRFGTLGSPQVHIAVMNGDGSNPTPVTNVNNTSDHDPTGSNSAVVFERFMKGTDYSQDPSFVFSPWNIIEARLDGSGERTLVADGWVNWLPVYDPTGQYLVHLKTVGYTDARLIDKNGRDLGRLIPDITKIRYIDWK